MDKIAQLCSLLEEKKALFEKYETATLSILESGADDAEKYIMERSEIANNIDETSEKIAWLCDEEPNSAVLLKITKAEIEFEKVPSEYQCVYYGGQAVRSVVARIMASEQQVLERLEKLRDEAKENIRNHQNLPKIKKYLTSLTPTGDVLNLRDEKV